MNMTYSVLSADELLIKNNRSILPVHNETALLLRLKHFYQQHKSILINPPDGADQYRELDLAGVLHDNYGNYQNWPINTAYPVWFDCHLADSPPEHDLIILFLPKGKQRLLAHLKLLAGRVKPNTTLILIGANDAGIKSAGKVLKTHCEVVTKIDTARHCQAWSAKISSTQKVNLEDLMTSWPITKYTANPIQLTSLPGTFAAGKLDPGSALLLDTLIAYFIKESKKPLSIDNVLDFGCGSGLLSVGISQHLPNSQFDAVDTDCFALKSCDKSFINNGLKFKVKPVYLPNEIQGRYQLIISNPPFHQGINTTTAATQAFIEHLPKLLTPKGQVWLVANRFLNYEAVFEKTGIKSTVVESTSAYKVIQARLS